MLSGDTISNKKFHSPANRESNVRNHRITDSPESDLIKACYRHARIIRNNFLDLEELVATETFDIIAITESWLNTKDRDFLAEYAFEFYLTKKL